VKGLTTICRQALRVLENGRPAKCTIAPPMAGFLLELVLLALFAATVSMAAAAVVRRLHDQMRASLARTKRGHATGTFSSQIRTRRN
jgi:hypothetical protein